MKTFSFFFHFIILSLIVSINSQEILQDDWRVFLFFKGNNCTEENLFELEAKNSDFCNSLSSSSQSYYCEENTEYINIYSDRQCQDLYGKLNISISKDKCYSKEMVSNTPYCAGLLSNETFSEFPIVVSHGDNSFSGCPKDGEIPISISYIKPGCYSTFSTLNSPGQYYTILDDGSLEIKYYEKNDCSGSYDFNITVEIGECFNDYDQLLSTDGSSNMVNSTSSSGVSSLITYSSKYSFGISS